MITQRSPTRLKQGTDRFKDIDRFFVLYCCWAATASSSFHRTAAHHLMQYWHVWHVTKAMYPLASLQRECLLDTTRSLQCCRVGICPRRWPRAAVSKDANSSLRQPSPKVNKGVPKPLKRGNNRKEDPRNVDRAPRVPSVA